MNWLNVPLSAIDREWPAALLKKAESFLRQGKVDELEESGNGNWIAFVRDTKDCDVQIRLLGADVAGCQCDCGAETMPCGHAAAVLLALRDRLAGTPAKTTRKAKTALEKKPARKKKETFEDILNRVSHDELKAFLKEAFGRQRDFRNMFMARFAEPDDALGKAGYVKLVKNILRSGVSRWGYIDGRGFRKIVKPMNELIKQAHIQIDKKQFLGPMHLGQAMLEDISERFTTDYDGGGYLQGFIHEGIQFFQKIFQSADTAQSLKNELWNYLLEQCPKPVYLDYGGAFHEEMMELLVAYAQTGEPENRLHRLLDEQLLALSAASRQDYIREFRKKYWLGWKIDLYRQLGRVAEMNALVDANLEIPEFRQIKLDQTIEAGRWDAALALVQDGIAIAIRQNHPGTVVEWKKQLLRIARLRGDRDQVRAQARELFQTDRFRLEYFKIIKSSYPPEEWSAAARDIFSDLEKRELPPDYLLPVLEEEQDWPGMFACIRKETRFDMLLRYEPVMLEHFPQESEKLYVGWLRQTAERASNRDEYKQVVALLQNLTQKYPTGKENAASLVREFRERYKRRMAMLEEFDKMK